jgi:L-asparaginase
MRGNRSVKVNANQFAAFSSPNFPPLATVGTEITINTSLLLPPPPPGASLSNPEVLEALQKQLGGIGQNVTTFSVIALILYPGIQASSVQGLLQATQPPVAGVVIESFGEGNGPSNPDFLGVLSNVHNNGVVLVDNTQVLMGSVNIEAYQTGSGLAKAGAISAFDMTPESSLTKMIYLFATGLAPSQVTQQMQVGLCGEVTVPTIKMASLASH